jgi:hypothetical protein
MRLSVSIPKSVFWHDHGDTNTHGDAVTFLLSPLLPFHLHTLAFKFYEDALSLSYHWTPLWTRYLTVAVSQVNMLLAFGIDALAARTISFECSRADAMPIADPFAEAYDKPVAAFHMLLRLFGRYVPKGRFVRFWNEERGECWVDGGLEAWGIGYATLPVRASWTRA